MCLGSFASAEATTGFALWIPTTFEKVDETLGVFALLLLLGSAGFVPCCRRGCYLWVRTNLGASPPKKNYEILLYCPLSDKKNRTLLFRNVLFGFCYFYQPSVTTTSFSSSSADAGIKLPSSFLPLRTIDATPLSAWFGLLNVILSCLPRNTFSTV